MTKIEEFEKKMIAQGMTNEDFITFQKLLQRVRSNFLKRQHCYTTAIQFQQEAAAQAIRLIDYGLENFDDGWFSTYNSHLYKGHIYAGSGNYQNAYISYLSARNVSKPNQDFYDIELSKDLMWTKLHIDAFQFSPELETHYLTYCKADSFSKELINSDFKMAVAEIVIALHYNQTKQAKAAYDKALHICGPTYVGKQHKLLKRHRYTEKLNTTPEVIEFLMSLQHRF